MLTHSTHFKWTRQCLTITITLFIHSIFNTYFEERLRIPVTTHTQDFKFTFQFRSHLRSLQFPKIIFFRTLYHQLNKPYTNTPFVLFILLSLFNFIFESFISTSLTPILPSFSIKWITLSCLEASENRFEEVEEGVWVGRLSSRSNLWTELLLILKGSSSSSNMMCFYSVEYWLILTNCCSCLLLLVSNVDARDIVGWGESDCDVFGCSEGYWNESVNALCIQWSLFLSLVITIPFLPSSNPPKMNGSVNPLTTKLYRVRKTVFKMLTKRGYSVDDNDMNMTLDTFLREVIETALCKG